MTKYTMTNEKGSAELVKVKDLSGNWNFINKFTQDGKKRCLISVESEKSKNEIINHWLEKGFSVLKDGQKI